MPLSDELNDILGMTFERNSNNKDRALAAALTRAKFLEDYFTIVG